MNHDEGLMRLAALIQEQRNDDATEACQTLAEDGTTLAETQAANQQTFMAAQQAAQEAFATALQVNQRTYTAAREAHRLTQAQALHALELERAAVNGQDTATMMRIIARHREIKEQHKQGNDAALAQCKHANEVALQALKRANQAAWTAFQQASRNALQQFNDCEELVTAELVQKAAERRALVRSVLERLPTTTTTHAATMGH